MENGGRGRLGMQRQRWRTVRVQYDLKFGAAENCFGDRKGQVVFSITMGPMHARQGPKFSFSC
jgi:hypothetical protein